MKIIVCACFLALTIISPVIFGMQEDQDSMGWDELPALPDTRSAQFDEIDPPVSEIPENRVPDLSPQFSPAQQPASNTFSQPQPLIATAPAIPIVPPLQIPFQNQGHETDFPQVPFLLLPAGPSPLEQFHREIMASIQFLFAYQQEHLALFQLLHENSKQIINVTFSLLNRLALVEAKCSNSQGQLASPIQQIIFERLKKQLEEKSAQQQAIPLAQSSTSLKELLMIQQATMQQIATILNVNLQEKKQ